MKNKKEFVVETSTQFMSAFLSNNSMRLTSKEDKILAASIEAVESLYDALVEKGYL